ncbi:MAG: hypothetical protein AVDCRST_MAG02-4227, partial [uncultured Rubrobacteraceae bacterium]
EEAARGRERGSSASSATFRGARGEARARIENGAAESRDL